MVKKTVSQVQIYVRDAVTRASRQAASKDFAGAVATLLPVLKNNPEVALLFEKIREYELAKLKTQGGGAKFYGLLQSLFWALFIKILSFIDPVRAMGFAESQLAFCVDNPIALTLDADAADAADAPWVAVTALQTFNKLHPGNPARLKRLAEAMQRNGQALDALKIHQDMLKAAPNQSLEAQAELRSAMALATIERGNFNDKKSTKANTADADDAIIQQLLNGTIHDASQAQLLIDRFNEELKQKDSVDMRRKLAEAYMVAEDFASALREYKTVAEKLGVMDPVLDKHIEKAYLSQIQQSINKLRTNPAGEENPEQKIAELEKEYSSYHWQHTQERAEKFPNDMQLQFDLGELQFESNMIDEAIATFEHVADNPQKHRSSMVYLCRCALLKNDPKHAIECAEDALKEMGRMDKQKREALYYLGNAYEALNETEKAVTVYRQINANMSNYRDVPERLQRLDGAENALKNNESQNQ